MTQEELRAWWPDLGFVEKELRRLNHADEADRLLDAVVSGATSGEILGLVGLVLMQSSALRSGLDSQGKTAWDRVMADINRAYPPNFRFNHWLAQAGGSAWLPRPVARWVIAFALAGLLLLLIVLLRAFP